MKSTSTSTSTSTSHTYRSLTALCLILILSTLAITWTHGGTVNNGDYSRVFDSMSIHVPGWVPLGNEYPLLDEVQGTAPASSMGVIGWTLAKLASAHDPGTIYTWQFGAILIGVYLLGASLLARETSANSTIILALLIPAAMMYGLYFRSLYEEAAVISFMPLLAASIFRLHKKGTLSLFLVSSVATLLAKAQMVFLLPLLLLCLWSGLSKARPILWRTKIIAAGLFLVVACSGYAMFLASTGGMTQINNYNRLYNGVGWAVQQSSKWPESHFPGRLAYFQANRETLQAATLAFEPQSELTLMGTSYWPEGWELSALAWQPGTTPETLRLIQRAVAEGEFRNYFRYLAQNPAVIAPLITNTYAAAIGSDYSLSYLRNPDSGSSYAARAFSKIGTYSLIFSLLTLLVTALLSRDWISLVAFTYVAFGAPMFVVLGDGYYEFEKHMTPYLMVTPAIVALFLCRLNRPKKEPAEPHQMADGGERPPLQSPGLSLLTHGTSAASPRRRRNTPAPRLQSSGSGSSNRLKTI